MPRPKKTANAEETATETVESTTNETTETTTASSPKKRGRKPGSEATKKPASVEPREKLPRGAKSDAEAKAAAERAEKAEAESVEPKPKKAVGGGGGGRGRPAGSGKSKSAKKPAEEDKKDEVSGSEDKEEDEEADDDGEGEEEEQPSPPKKGRKGTETNGVAKKGKKKVLQAERAQEILSSLQNIWPEFELSFKQPPRKGSFELAFINEDGGEVNLWSGLKKGPPRALKFPAHDVIIEQIQKIFD